MLPTEPRGKPIKGFFFHGNLPHFVDEKQPPLTKRPFSIVWKTKWAHSMHLLLPSEMVETVEEKLRSQAQNFQYAKVMMSLGDILSGDFFNKYIKQGNISMLSEGRHEVDNLIYLHEGILYLEVDRPTFERIGLQGVAISDGGAKHKKSRLLIQMNLRSPSMLHGKKDFDRLVRAASTAEDAPIQPHHPRWISNNPKLLRRDRTRTPGCIKQLTPGMDSKTFIGDGEYIQALEEWLSLAKIGSARLSAHDDADPYICRYQMPSTPQYDANESESLSDLVCFQWHGFITSRLIMAVLLLTTKACGSTWSALSWDGFNKDSTTVLQLPQYAAAQEYLEWDFGLRN